MGTFEFTQDRWGLVLRTVVDRDDFKPRIILRQERREGRREFFGFIPSGENYRNHGRVWGRNRGYIGKPRQASHPDAGPDTLNHPKGGY